MNPTTNFETHTRPVRATSPTRTAGRQLLDLSGAWQVRVLDAELQRNGADPDLDDADWATLEVPGHWADSEEFADNDRPLLYRRRFSVVGTSPPSSSRRYWLRMEGVMSDADVWLDGHHLGVTTGYFAPRQFDVTSLLGRGTEHVVAADVRCTPPEPGRTMETATDDGPRDKTALTGSLQVGPLAPSPNPGGIWRPVTVDVTGPVAIVHGRLLCTEVTAERASLSIRAVLDATEAVTGRLRAAITPVDVNGHPSGARGDVLVRPQPLARGENRIEWHVEIADPQLWWPATMGDQPMYEVSLSIDTVDDQHAVSDQMSWVTGLRQVSMNNMVWTVNGRRLFLKSVAYGPAHPFPASLSTADIQVDLDTVTGAGFNTVRVAGHIAHPELLHVADRAGLMVWQDLPLIGGYSSKARRAVKTLIREAVDAVAHHPSVIAWGGHCQPNGEAVARPTGDSVTHPARQIIRHVLPSWNRSFLDSIVGRELVSADPTRPTVARSGHIPSRLDQPSDSRLWLGWRMGRSEDGPELFDRWPNLAMFPAGIGAQSLVMPGAATGADWATAEFNSLTRYVNPHDFEDFESWVRATETYQAELLRHQIESIRRRRYRPSGGYCVTALADAEPWGGFGLVRFDRTAKSALAAVARANRPVLPIVVDPPSSWPAETAVTVTVEVLNDLFYGLDAVEVQATVGASPNVEPTIHNWRLDIGPDGPTVVATLDVVTPATGELTIALALKDSGSVVDNHYRIPVSSP